MLIAQHLPTNQISGRIVSIDENEFILNAGNQPIKVDAKSESIRKANLKVGEQVTVIGEYDDGEFDSRKIIRSDGVRIAVKDDY